MLTYIRCSSTYSTRQISMCSRAGLTRFRPERSRASVCECVRDCSASVVHLPWSAGDVWVIWSAPPLFQINKHDAHWPACCQATSISAFHWLDYRSYLPVTTLNRCSMSAYRELMYGEDMNHLKKDIIQTYFNICIFSSSLQWFLNLFKFVYSLGLPFIYYFILFFY